MDKIIISAVGESSQMQSNTRNPSLEESQKDKGNPIVQQPSTLFPIHDAVIASFNKGPEVGAKAVQSVLHHATTTSLSKLQLMARLLNEVGEKAALLILPHMADSAQQFSLNLPQLRLKSPELLEKFIHFLFKQKRLFSRGKDDLYVKIIDDYKQRNDTLGEIYFSKLMLKSASLTPQMRHTLLFNLSGYSQDESEATTYITEAFHLEKSGKLTATYLRTANVIALWLIEFQESLQFNFNDPFFHSLKMAIKFAPDAPEVFKVLDSFVDQVLRHALVDLNATAYLLINAFNLTLSLPKAASRRLALLKSILNLPEEFCELGEKIYYCALANQLDQAFELATVELRKNPLNSSVLNQLASILKEQNKLSEAANCYATVLESKDFPVTNRSLIYTQLAWINLQCGKITECIQNINKALALDAENVSALTILVYAYFNLEERKKAALLLDSLKARFPGNSYIEKVQQDIFQRNVSPAIDLNSNVHTLITEVYYHLNHQEFEHAKKKAFFALEKSVAIGADPTQQAHLHCFIADIYLAEKNYQAALDHLELAKKYKDPLSLALQRMISHYGLKQYPQAEEQAWAILLKKEATSKRATRERLSAYQTIMGIYQDTQNYQQGVQQLSKAFSEKMIPLLDQKYLYYLLAKLLLKADNLIAAEDSAYQATQLLPGSLFFEENDLLLTLGIIYLLNKKPDLAITVLKKLLKKNGDNPRALFYLGHAYYRSYISHSQDHAAYKNAIKTFSQLLTMNSFYLIELARTLPAALIEKLQDDPSCATPVATSAIESVAVSVPEKAHYAVDEVLLETKNVAVSHPFSDEQLLHRQIQAEKKRLRSSLQEIHLEEESELAEEKSSVGWQLPAPLGFVSIEDKRVAKISLTPHAKANSHLHALLAPALEEKCESQILSKWKGLIDHGKVVGKKGQQGIRLLTAQESDKLALKLGTGYVAKLKLIGVFGNARAYAKAIPSENDEQDTLLYFDRLVLKAH